MSTHLYTARICLRYLEPRPISKILKRSRCPAATTAARSVQCQYVSSVAVNRAVNQSNQPAAIVGRSSGHFGARTVKVLACYYVLAPGGPFSCSIYGWIPTLSAATTIAQPSAAGQVGWV